LLLNSIKFTSQGTIDFGYTLANNTLVFHVKDTGVGIAENCKESIFERFVQGDTSISRGYEGAGLGLSICKGLVLLMGGSIWVESKENEGATFYFTLPLPYTTYTSEAVEQPSAEVVVKGNILIAEDDEFSFEYLKELLEGTSCRLLRAENGAKVLEMATNIPGIDLILMDIKMPVMDGLVATKRIKALKPHIPIIAQSAFVFDSERQMMHDAGCDDYLSKPIKREELMNMMQKYMSDK
jgi:CheY-like chemotaxis protein